MKEKIKGTLQNHVFIYKLVRILSHFITLLKIILFKILSIFFGLFPLSDRIIFSNFYGSGFFDNPKYVALLIEREFPNVKMIWLINKENYNDFPIIENMKLKRNSFFNQLYYLSTSKYWVDNCRKKYIPFKRKKQIYIQFWHGGLGLKKVENSDKNRYLIAKIEAYFDTRNTDFMISNSKHLTDIFRKDFNFKGEVLELGYPMNDKLSKVSLGNKKLNNKSITILYAPTFRGNEVQNKIPNYFPDFEFLYAGLKQNGISCRIIIRTHPSVKFNLNQHYGDLEYIEQGNSNKDIKEILNDIDLFISDYSSAVFDCLITKTPAVLYVKDLNDYINERGLYYNLDEVPFPHSKEMRELLSSILEFDYDNYLVDVKNFINKTELKDDGYSGHRFVRFMENIMKGEIK